MNSDFLVRSMLGVALVLIVLLASTVRPAEPDRADRIKDHDEVMQAHVPRAIAAKHQQAE